MTNTKCNVFESCKIFVIDIMIHIESNPSGILIQPSILLLEVILL